MGLFEALESIFNIWLIIMIIGIPIIIFQAIAASSREKDRQKKDLEEKRRLYSALKSERRCCSCKHRNGDHTTFIISPEIFCFKYNKQFDWMSGGDAPGKCPYYEIDPCVL